MKGATPVHVAHQGLAAATTLHVLHPGDVALGWQGDRLQTLLGSCVAVILTDPRRTVGAMCHIVHCAAPPPHDAGNTAYASAAFARMHLLLRGCGIEPYLCEAHVYGGGNMFPGLSAPGHVGDANARWVMDALAHDGVRVLNQDLGGNAYRRLSWVVGQDMPQVTAVAV
ncbi:MAG: chemotaxis protein CheD [Aquabacterium sp.]|nr:chemotaxis protein CheD [Aquabacterium sp.]